jgi:hypothetical protein
MSIKKTNREGIVYWINLGQREVPLKTAHFKLGKNSGKSSEWGMVDWE